MQRAAGASPRLADGPPDLGGDITLPVGGDGRRLGKPQGPGFPISVKYLSVKVTLARLANPESRLLPVL